MLIVNMKAGNHIPYEKITEDLDKYSLSEKEFRELRKQRWIVTEKIHGAHLCIHTDGKTTAYAKRKEFLTPGDDFFHYKMLKADIDPLVTRLFSLVKKDFPQAEQLLVYGELFGGEYPHPEVEPQKGVQAVQTGVYYCPDIRFCAFDMAIKDKRGSRIYIDFPRFSSYAEEVSLFYTHALHKGSLHEALMYDIVFESTIPGLLGLPSLGPGNKAEGIVIKPETPFLVNTPKGPIRPVIKRKTREFSEDNRYHQAQKWNTWKQQGKSPGFKKKKERREIDLNDAFIKGEIDPLVNEQRLACVISKTGRLTKKNKNRILHAFIDDIMEAISLQFPTSCHQLSKEDNKKLYTIIKEKCKRLLTPEK